MKYFIDVEKIEGTNLWKAKGFNTLVFDKNGLMKLIALEDELNNYYRAIKDENEKLKRRLESASLKEVYLQEQVDEIDKDLDKAIAKNKTLLRKVTRKQRTIDFLKEKIKLHEEKNVSLKDEIEDCEELCTKLQNEKAELLKKYEEKCLLLERLLDKFPKEENVPIEVVLDDKRYNKVIGRHDDTLIDESAFIDDYTLRKMKRMNHTIKSQKGMLIKQGKDISRLQKENKWMKDILNFWEDR